MADKAACNKKDAFLRSAVHHDDASGGHHEEEEEEGTEDELPDQGPFSDEEFHLIVEVGVWLDIVGD